MKVMNYKEYCMYNVQVNKDVLKIEMVLINKWKPKKRVSQ